MTEGTRESKEEMERKEKTSAERKNESRRKKRKGKEPMELNRQRI